MTVHAGSRTEHRATAELWGVKLSGYSTSEWRELAALSDLLTLTLYVTENQVYFYDNNSVKIVVAPDVVGRAQVRGALQRIAGQRTS